MRFFAAVGIVLITVALAVLNVSGAYIASGGNIAYTAVICGVEITAATCLVLMLAAPTWPRKITAGFCAAALVFVAVSNGKVSVTTSFASVYKDEKGRDLSPEALRKKAAIATGEAADLKVTAPAQHNKDEEEIASINNELDLMSSPARTKEAQTRLMALGLYTGAIDGLDRELTADARRSRGDVLRKRLELLTTKTEAKAAPSSEKAVEAVDLTAKAEAIEAGRVQLYGLLLAVELARTAGLWAFVIWSSAKPAVKVDPSVFADLQAQADELAERRRRAAEGAEKAVGTKTKRKKREEAIVANLKAVEDLRERVDESTVPLHADDDIEDAGDSVMTAAQLEAATESDGSLDEDVTDLSEDVTTSDGNVTEETENLDISEDVDAETVTEEDADVTSSDEEVTTSDDDDDQKPRLQAAE